MLRRVILIGLITASCLVLATPAWAKGVSRASIEGPGLAEPIVIEQTDGKGDLSRLLEASGFWQLLFGGEEWKGGPLAAQPPTGDLGPVYRVTWYLGDDPYPAASDIYPLATGGPLVHVEEGKSGSKFGVDTIPGGWFAPDPILVDLLAGYSVPMAASESFDLPGVLSSPETGLVSVVLTMVLVGSGIWVLGRRSRRIGAP